MSDHLRLLLEDLRDMCLLEQEEEHVSRQAPKPGKVRTSNRYLDRTAMVTSGNIFKADEIDGLLKQVKLKGKTIGDVKTSIAGQMEKALKPGFFGGKPDYVRFITMFAPLAHAYAERDKHSAKSFRDDLSIRNNIFDWARDNAIPFAKENATLFERLRKQLSAAFRDMADIGYDESGPAKPGRKKDLFEDVLLDTYERYLRQIQDESWASILDKLQSEGLIDVK